MAPIEISDGVPLTSHNTNNPSTSFEVKTLAALFQRDAAILRARALKAENAIAPREREHVKKPDHRLVEYREFPRVVSAATRAKLAEAGRRSVAARKILRAKAKSQPAIVSPIAKHRRTTNGFRR
jgi:hypothetical protein